MLEGPLGARPLQPQVMAVLMCLAQKRGEVVTRRALFETCWGNAPVGDDSLNQTIKGIRTVLEAVGMKELSIETIPRTGYRLVVPQGDDEVGRSELERAVETAYDCWRAGLPKADTIEIAELESQLAKGAGADHWGVLALLLRKAAEYGDAADCASFVHRCERAARRALQLDPGEGNALTALAGLAPLFGNWSHNRRQLLANLESNATNVAARHDLAVLEMATGRVSAAFPLIEQLLSEDSLAASFHYKRMYHLWSLEDVNGAEQVASRALALWPRHPAIWAARFWILVFTQRAEQALRLLGDESCRPDMPPAAAQFLGGTARAVASVQAGERSPGVDSHIDRCVDVAARGPANAVSALFSLCALGAIDQAFEVACGYYLGLGRTAVPLRWNADDPSITDQHRRITQPLFIPAAREMRQDPRFLTLCRDIGLEAYWAEFALVPDFLAQ